MIERRWLGSLPYTQALTMQRRRRDAVIAGQAPEAIFLLEHDPAVVTLGRRSAPGNPTATALAALGIETIQTERGGLATWHGPGQIMAYLIIDIGRRPLGVREFVHAVEQGVINWLQTIGLDAGRRPGFPGVWMGHDKICAIGLHFRRGVSMHGLALNFRQPPPGGFDLIVPCGITDGGITSVEAHLGREFNPATMQAAAMQLGQSLIQAMDGPPQRELG